MRAQIGPNPRIIDEVSWAKLMAAGLTLNSEDLNEYGPPVAKTNKANKAATGGRRLYYPIEMVRALVDVWLFAGCRIDEIRRLDIDCTVSSRCSNASPSPTTNVPPSKATVTPSPHSPNAPPKSPHPPAPRQSTRHRPRVRRPHRRPGKPHRRTTMNTQPLLGFVSEQRLTVVATEQERQTG